MADRNYGLDDNANYVGLNQKFYEREEGLEQPVVDVINRENELGFTLVEALNKATYFKQGGIQRNDNVRLSEFHGDEQNNEINGSEGADKMYGHKGDDVYVVNHEGDQVIEYVNEGIDTVKIFLPVYTLPDNVEKLDSYNDNESNILTGNSLDNYIRGYGQNDKLYGKAGNDELYGMGGNDLLDGGDGADKMWGEEGNDELYGRDGNDHLNGGNGVDKMWGGRGDDVYYVDNSNDQVYEQFGEGIDTVRNSIAVYTLPDNVERLDSNNNNESNILTGNSLDNYIISYHNDDKLYGKEGNDELHGADGNDLLDGGEGNDILDGGQGADHLEGGTGNDRYYVDNAGDKVIEKANEGTDWIYASVNIDLLQAANVEHATLTGEEDLSLSGSNDNNHLIGNAGNNHLKGLAGNDWLAGGTGNDWLEGGEGDDILNGNAGADRMIGGTGNDVYYVDNRGDVVVEEANGGRDTVNVFFDYDLMKVTHIENAILIGTANAGLQGNNEANLLKGNAGNNHLKGLAGNDWLEGGAGDDILNGNAGADRMIGGTGNDVYYVDNRGDVVVEEANGGRDTVNVFFDYDLMKVAHIENAALIGTANAGLQGNNGANLLKGNTGNNQLKGLGGNDWLDGGAGNDVLIGGSGKDTLVGGAGKDTFKFVDMADSTLSLRDVITDFKRGEDKIDLSALDANTKSAGDQAFSFIGAAGFSAAGQVRFAGGVVYGDVNGDKVADFAIELKNVTTLQASDFIL